jgi:hypothetical protein
MNVLLERRKEINTVTSLLLTVYLVRGMIRIELDVELKQPQWIDCHCVRVR